MCTSRGHGNGVHKFVWWDHHLPDQVKFVSHAVMTRHHGMTSAQSVSAPSTWCKECHSGALDLRHCHILTARVLQDTAAMYSVKKEEKKKRR